MCACVKNVDHELLVERNEQHRAEKKAKHIWRRQERTEKKKREKKVETIMNIIIVSMCDFSVP